MFCKKCGRKIKPESRKCPYCNEAQVTLVESKFFDGTDEVFYKSWAGDGQPVEVGRNYDHSRTEANREKNRRIQKEIESLQQQNETILKNLFKQKKRSVITMAVALLALLIAIVLGVISVVKVNNIQRMIAEEQMQTTDHEEIEQQIQEQNATDSYISDSGDLSIDIGGTWVDTQNRDNAIDFYTKNCTCKYRSKQNVISNGEYEVEKDNQIKIKLDNDQKEYSGKIIDENKMEIAGIEYVRKDNNNPSAQIPDNDGSENKEEDWPDSGNQPVG